MRRRTTAATDTAGRHALVAWRIDRLTGAGFPPALAEALARDRRVDLHELLGLVDRGCPPATAARIVAPL